MQFFFGKYAFMKECRLQNDKKKRKKYGKLQKKIDEVLLTMWH